MRTLGFFCFYFVYFLCHLYFFLSPAAIDFETPVISSTTKTARPQEILDLSCNSQLFQEIYASGIFFWSIKILKLTGIQAGVLIHQLNAQLYDIPREDILPWIYLIPHVTNLKDSLPELHFPSMVSKATTNIIYKSCIFDKVAACTVSVKYPVLQILGVGDVEWYTQDVFLEFKLIFTFRGFWV